MLAVSPAADRTERDCLNIHPNDIEFDIYTSTPRYLSLSPPDVHTRPLTHLPSILGRHIHARLPAFHGILCPPETRHRLRLRVKVDPALAIERIRAPARNALLVPREAEHGQGDGDRGVDADLARFDLLLEPGGGGAGAGEDGDAVAVLVAINKGNGGGEVRHGEADEDGAEDFRGVAGHVGLDVGDDCRRELGEERWGLVYMLRNRLRRNLQSCR